MLSQSHPLLPWCRNYHSYLTSDLLDLLEHLHFMCSILFIGLFRCSCMYKWCLPSEKCISSVSGPVMPMLILPTFLLLFFSPEFEEDLLLQFYIPLTTLYLTLTGTWFHFPTAPIGSRKHVSKAYGTLRFFFLSLVKCPRDALPALRLDAVPQMMSLFCFL